MRKSYYLLFLFPLVVFLFTETIFFNGLKKLILWIIQNPFNALIGYLIIFSIINILYFFNQRLFKIFSILLGYILILLSFVSHVKYQYRGDILTPSDLFLINEGSNVSTYLNKSIFIELLAYLVLFSLFIVIFIFFRWKKLALKPSIIVSAACLSLLLLLPFSLIISPKEDLPVKNSYGFIAGLADNIFRYSQNNITTLDYNENAISKITSNDSSQEIDDSFKPNVIIVLSEAFWDPTTVPNLKLTEDPLPFYHNIIKSYSSGEVLSPVFGGSTANPEFESLTGLSTRFIEQATPYVEVVNKPIDSLASIYSRQGYKSSVIHSYHNWFYNRPSVYNYFGFDNFISGEFFMSPTMIGPFMDDKDLFNRLVKELKSSPEPDFIYTISMLNHGPYSSDRFKDIPSTATGNLKDSTKRNLDIYTHSLSFVDQALNQLINDLNKIEEPTLLVYFGDHLPLLGENFDVYKDLNFFNDGRTLDEYKNKYTTPILIWNNYGLKKRDLGIISPNFIGTYVLEMSKKKGNAIYDLLTSIKNQGITVIPEEKYYSNFNISDNTFDNFKLLQYDVLFGSNFSGTDNNENTKSPLIMGSEKINIDSITPETIGKDDGDFSLHVTGKNFIPKSYYFDFIKGSQIFINGTPYETEFINESSINCLVNITMK